MSKPSNQEQTASGAKTYRRLFTYVTPYWKPFLLAIICNIAYGYIDTKFIKSIEPLLDEGLINKNMEFLTIAPLFVIAILVVRGLVGFIASYCMAWVGSNVVKTMRKELFNRYLLLPATFFDRHNSGELLSKVTYNTEQLTKSATDAVTNIVRNTAFIIYALWNMFVASWYLTLLFLVTGPLIAILVTFTTRRFRVISRRMQNAMGDISHVTQEGIESYRDIKIYGGIEYEQECFEKVNNYSRLQNMKMEITKGLSVPVIQLLAGCGLALVLYFSVVEVISGALTPGGFVVMVLFMMLMLKPIKALTSVNAVLQRGVAAAESVFEIIDEEPETDKGALTIEKTAGNLSFKNVSFQYPGADKLSIDNISFEIPAGKSIAIVGRSGSGKSTLASLLLRFYNINTGEISLDEQSIADYKLRDYRQQIAFVSQHVNLFNDTIAHNIAYGNLDNASNEKIIEAAKKAYAWEFICELPDGLNTQIGERGMSLSGGQRQRLAIARAILKNAPILILDEATSALDTESEKFIQKAMQSVMHNRTTVVVAHRLSTIESADNILVMDQGKIKESGTHAELLLQDGIYAGLHKMQFQE